jgi:tetratricopeptide (TPR) repeat protein
MAILYLKGLDNTGMELSLGKSSKPLDPEVKEKISKLIVLTWSNMSACYLKLEQYDKALDMCDKVIKQDPKNAKALFRKGQALSHLNVLDSALQTLKSAAQIEPSDIGIRQEIQKVKEKLTELDRKSREELKNNLARQL